MESSEEHEVLVDTEDVEVKVPCEVYSRIVGYLRPVQAWNQGKQQEFQERQVFDIAAPDHVAP